MFICRQCICSLPNRCWTTKNLIAALFLTLSFTVWSVNTGVDASMITLDLEPTTLLLLQNTKSSIGHRRLDEDTDEIITPDLVIHPYTAGVYSALIEIDVDKTFALDAEGLRGHRNLSENGDVQQSVGPSNNFTRSQIEEYNDILREFNSLRHLSRHESHYRRENGFPTEEYEYVDDDQHVRGSRYDSPSLSEDERLLKRQEIIGRRRILKENTGGIGALGLIGGVGAGAPIPLEERLEGNVFLNDYQSAPLSQGLGTHYATVWVGTPTPQRKTLIVDTGSHHTAFPCKGCNDCGEEHHTDKNFEPDSSRTFHPLTCDECLYGAQCVQLSVQEATNVSAPFGCVFSQSYTEGSTWQAFQVNDNVFFGGRDVLSAADPTDHRFSVNFMFGCQTLETGLFVTQLADGIMGLSQHEATLPRAMYDQGKIERRVFAMCFRREVVVSKKGISAGVITLGGTDTTLHTSPMLWVKNLSVRGWYTIYIKNIYLRDGGGQSARNDDPTHANVKRITGDTFAMNSGKGVILDSGTTDTYLHISMEKPFSDAWKKITGKAYTNNPIKLSRGDLLKLPTILIQMMAYDKHIDPNFGSPDDIVGLAGSTLDHDSPHDILLAVPSTHYMEYSPSKGVYTSRFYFSETQGGVIGANSLQGHDVIFDWEHGRIGLAESDCVIVGSLSDTFTQKNEAADCVLKDPVLSVECRQTIDVSQCKLHDPEFVLVGTETWSTIVEFPGLSSGSNCEEILMQTPLPGPSQDSPSTVQCGSTGICTVRRPCEILCSDASVIQPPVRVEPTADDKYCGDDYTWGACLGSCVQSKMSSVLMSDGFCHENKIQRETRSCHVDFCGRSDPCHIPFIVHVILGFLGADFSIWSKGAEDCVVNAFTTATNTDEFGNFVPYFEPGDVKILMVSPWYQETLGTLESPSPPGVKVVLEVSLYNPQVTGLPQKYDAPNVNNPKHRRLSECKTSDLYPVAIKAHEIHTKFDEAGFMENVISALKNNPTMSIPNGSLFAQTVSNKKFVEGSIVFSSWTIATEISGEAIYDHKIDAYLDHRDSVQVAFAYLHKYLFLTFIVLFGGIIFCTRSGKNQIYKKDNADRRTFVNQCRDRMKKKMTQRSSIVRHNSYSNVKTPYFDENDTDGQHINGEESCNSKYSKLKYIISN